MQVYSREFSHNTQLLALPTQLYGSGLSNLMQVRPSAESVGQILTQSYYTPMGQLESNITKHLIQPVSIRAGTTTGEYYLRGGPDELFSSN